MRWVLVVLGLLVAIFLGMYAAGSMLPVHHTVIRSVTLHQSPEAVWQVLTDHADDPRWRPDVESVTRLADRKGHPVWEEKYRNGDTLRLETLLQTPPLRLERSIVDQSAFAGTWTYTLAPSADGKSVVVTIREDGIVFEPLYRFVGGFIIGFEATTEKYLKALAAKFGEKAEWPRG